MKSSTGKYFIALDHVRALAALIVFLWHFVHAGNGFPIPFEFTPSVFFLSIFNEGHTGVALFMTLSGYLFAKLLEGKKIRYGHFLWNRFLRLAPLLIVVVCIVGFRDHLNGGSSTAYLFRVAKGILFPTLPNGGWSITAEFHFYLILPLLLWITWRSKFGLVAVILALIAMRYLIFNQMGEIHRLSYWTIVGRIDQFILGIIAFKLHKQISGRHLIAACTLVAFALFYWWFDLQGGFYKMPSYPSPSPLWIIMPTIEGATFALLIAWYDNSFVHSHGKFSRFLSLIGTYSYSIYLLHFFIVFKLASFIHNNIFDLSNYYVATLIGVACFMLMIPISYLSYRFIESPFLKVRTRYIS